MPLFLCLFIDGTLRKKGSEIFMAEIKFISYDGQWPNACRGNLVLEINGEIFSTKEFNEKEDKDEDIYCCLVSGGKVTFDKNWREHVTKGPWKISELPKRYLPYKKEIEKIINENIHQGCCGGCV